MRSNIQKTGVALVALIGLVLAATGCSPAVNSAKKFDASTVSCTEVDEALEAAANDLKSAEANSANAVSSITLRNSDREIASLEDKISALEARATECKSEGTPTPTPTPTPTVDEAALAQCRTTALVAYMTKQGFKDGEYVVGEERIDTSKPEFSRQGSLGFRKDGTLPKNRQQLQKLLDSTDPNIALAVKAQTRKFPNLDKSVVLNARNWEIVQTTVESQVKGNTGLNGGSQVAVGNTTAAAGDAAWILIDTDTCKVPRAKIDAAGKKVKKGTPEKDLPVAALRPGCINPTDGLEPKSSNPADYRQPGDNGKGQDVGTGKRPKSEITEKADKKPKKVKTKEKNSHTGVTDSADKDPGSETGGDAKGTDKGSKSGDGSGTGNGGSETYPDDDDIPEDQGGGGDGAVGGF